MEISFKIAVNTSKELIWEHYFVKEKRCLWEDDLESLVFNGEIKTGTTGRMKLRNMPEMNFVLSKIVKNESYHDKYEIPNVGTLYFCHDIMNENDTVFIKHSIRSDEDNEKVLGAMSQIFSDFPQTLYKLKHVVEK